MDNKKRSKKTVADTVCRVHKFGGYAYGMSSSTLHKWIKKYTQVKVSDTETMTMSEIKKCRKN